MTVKSIVDIEINSDKFAAFAKLFASYQDQLSKSPAAWSKVNKETAAAQRNMDRITAALLAHRQLSKEESEAAAKQTKTLTVQERLWTSMSRSTKDAAKNIENATVSLLRWTGVVSAVGGLFGLGGLWGLEHMASRVTDQRNSARGLGVSIGEQRAFGINLRGVVNTDSLLSGTSEALSDVTKQGGLQALGVNTNGSTADVAIALLKAVRAQALATPLDNLGMLESKFHLSEFGIDNQVLRTLKSMSAGEYESRVGGLQSDSRALNINDDTAYRWSKFTAQMERAGNQVENIFVKGLQNLADPLTHLSKSVMTLLDEAMAKDGTLSKGIDTIAGWIDGFATKIAKPDFLVKIDKFKDNLSHLADTVDDLINHPVRSIAQGAWAGVGDIFSGASSAMGFMGSLGKSAYDRFTGAISQATAGHRINSMEYKYGLPSGLEDYVWGHETSRGLTGPAHGKWGGMGPLQVAPVNANGYDLNNFDQASERAAQILAKELSNYNGDVMKALAAYRYGESGADALFAKDKHWREKEKSYWSDWHGPMQVNVMNTTGGNAIVQTNQLAPGK